MVKDREEEVMEAENEVWTQIKRISQSLSEVRKSSLGGISGASAFVLIAKPWEDWWRVQFHSRLRRSRPQGNVAAPSPLARVRIPPATQANANLVDLHLLQGSL